MGVYATNRRDVMGEHQTTDEQWMRPGCLNPYMNDMTIHRRRYVAHLDGNDDALRTVSRGRGTGLDWLAPHDELPVI